MIGQETATTGGLQTSPASSQAARFERRLLPVLRRHPLFGFFLLAYSFSWLEEFVLLMAGPPAALVTLLAPVGPACAALIIIRLIDGRPGLGRLVRRVKLDRTRVDK